MSSSAMQKCGKGGVLFGLERAPPTGITSGKCLSQSPSIAGRVSRELHCDPANGHIRDDRKAMKLWRREYEKGWAPVV